jgi:hypothetical protein
MALSVISLCEKLLQLPKKNITLKINLMFHFFVINPRVHDIYMTNLLYCTTRHLHPKFQWNDIQCPIPTYIDYNEIPLDWSNGFAWWSC